MRDLATPAPLACPAGHLQDPATLSALLAARASPQRDIVISILGFTHGQTAIAMRAKGSAFVRALVESLGVVGAQHYLLITPFLGAPGQHLDASDRMFSSGHRSHVNMCEKELQPAGLCCGWSDFGFDLLRGNKWGIYATHPYMMYLQRWWFAAKVVAMGYNLLSLDSDLHVASNPFDLLRSGAFRHLDVAFQGDAGWPVLARKPGSVDEVAIPACGHDRAWPESSCACHRFDGSKTKLPTLNTGFVYARAHNTSARLFDLVISTIAQRLAGPPMHKVDRTKPGGTTLDTDRVWAQSVMNEAVANMSRLPPPSDGTAQPPSGSGTWLATLGRHRDGSCWPKAQMLSVTELVSEEGIATLGALPRSVVGRICAKRKLPLPHANVLESPPLPCSTYSASKLLGQTALHAQFTNELTRERMWNVFRWWRPSPAGSPVDDDHNDCRPAAIRPGTTALLVSSASANRSIVCLDPAPNTSTCPCCWHAPAATPELASIHGCKLWNTNW